MLPALRVKGGVVIADSRDVAAKFGKESKHVNEAIRNMLAEAPEGVGSNFRPFTIQGLTDPNRGKTSHYEMTRDGFSLLAMGFTGAAALAWKLKYIDAFNRMEAELRADPILCH